MPYYCNDRMISKERINRILNFQTPDRVGIKDLFWDETLISWQKRINRDPEDYFDFDIKAFTIDEERTDSDLKNFFSEPNKERFLALSFSEPFERYAGTHSIEVARENIGKYPKEVFNEFKDDLDEVLSRAIGILDKGYEFDGLWLFGDIAHNRGLFFSHEFYEKHLFPYHKEICYFFASYGMPTILHSDGDVSDIIPSLIKAGVRALHPVPQSAGLDIKALKREYGKDMVLFGNFDPDIFRAPRKVLEELIPAHLDVCKEGGGYIFGLDSPLGPTTNIDDYGFILNLVKEYGRY